MFLLTDKFENKFEYKENMLNIDMSFDNILRMFELFEDEAFSSYEKILIAVEMFVIEYELIEDLSYPEQFEIYKYVMKEFLDIDIEGNDDEKDIEQKNNKKLMNFTKDAGLIYASFLSEYGIDLFKEHGKLHWDKFSELLTNLGDTTAFKEVVKYRTMKIPSSKEASQEYREHIKKMKKIYSLENEVDIQEDMESKLDSIASSFRGDKK